MSEQLVAALAAFLLAAAALIRDELARRRLRDQQLEHSRQLQDVRRKVGADRRAADATDDRQSNMRSLDDESQGP